MAAKKQQPAEWTQDEEEQILSLLAQRQEMAEALHGCTSRTEAEGLLNPISGATETVQLGLVKALVKARDAQAADVLLALNELAPDKGVRKEAKRALLQLAGAKVVPSWTPEAERAALGLPAQEAEPRFWKGSVMESRETGEVHLVLTFEFGQDYTEARVLAFMLDFWAEGVKECVHESGSKRQIESRVRELQQKSQAAFAEEGQRVSFVSCTLADGRRLLQEALEVNRWRKTEPAKDFRQNLPLVQHLILHAQEAGEDSGRTFIGADNDPDMIVANFSGAWTMGDFGLCYDLLTASSPLRKGKTRSEWVEQHRQWADEAQPRAFDLHFLRELEKPAASALWVPASVLSVRAGGPKELEFGWSVELETTPLSGTLPEMPLGTAVNRQTGRHWFWVAYTLEQEQGMWRLARIRDEGLAAQGLPVEELRRRIQEHLDFLEKTSKEKAPDSQEELTKKIDEMTTRVWKVLALVDAQIAREPHDRKHLQEAYGHAMSLRSIERGMVYASQTLDRFPDAPDFRLAQQQMAALEAGMAERYAQRGQPDEAEACLARGEALLRAALSEEDALGYAMLAELLVDKGELEEGEKLLLTARERVQDETQKAEIEFNLANLAIHRERYPEAQHYLERLSAIAPDYPSVWYGLGLVHNRQKQGDEAMKYYRKALEKDPTDIRAYTDVVGLFMDADMSNEARDVLNMGMRINPESAVLRALMALVYADKKDKRRAQEYLNEAERLNPNIEMVQMAREVIRQL